MPKRVAPGVSDLVFGLVLVATLVGGRSRMLNDPGTFWHLRLGRDILANRALPRVDTLTFTHTGEPWVDQSWLFDAALAVVVDRLGWSSAVLLAALGIASVYAGLARFLARDGRSPLVVFAASLLAAGAGSIHFLLRPHLFTFGFVLWTLRICRAQHERGGYRVFAVPAITAVWANLHGGFLAGPLIVFTAAAGHLVSEPGASGRRRGASTFFAAGVLSLLAALANPYGLGLYRHVAKLLVSSGVTELIDEYQPIPFGKPDARVVEWIILGLIALPALTRSKMTRYELSHALVWLHLALASVRHAPLFALAAAAGFASLLDGLVTRPNVRPEGPGDAPPWLWPGVAAAALAVAVGCGARLSAFDRSTWPLDALPSLNAAPSRAPLFHEQDWGGLIAAETSPTRPTFLDDRFELYGKGGILRYVNAIEGGPDWEAARDRYGIGLVWVRPNRGLARRLADDPSWHVRYRDAVSVLFERSGAPAAGRVSAILPLDNNGRRNDPSPPDIPGRPDGDEGRPRRPGARNVLHPDGATTR